jgi:hypothetical protein
MLRITTSLAAFGLLLAVAMVCATPAQTPQPEPVQHVVPIPVYPAVPGGSSPPNAYTPTGNGAYTIHAVGRYQAMSHEGQLVLIDTATGECWRLEADTWTRIAPSIAEAQKNERERDIRPQEPSATYPHARLIGD